MKSHVECALLVSARAFRCLALLLAVCAPAAAAPAAVGGLETPVDVSGGWVQRLGDDPAWASPDLDDSGWEPVDLDEVWSPQNHERFAGVSWYRLQLQLPPGAGRAVPLGLTIGRLHYGAYEVYAGGALVGRQGAFPPDAATARARPEVYAVPADAVGPDGRLVLAVRLWRDAAFALVAKTTGGQPLGPFALGALDDANDLVEIMQLRELTDSIPMIVLVSLLTLVGLYHIHLFLRRRQLREYFWFGFIALVALPNLVLSSAVGASLTSSLTAGALTMVSFHTNAAAWLQFLALLFGWRLPWWARAYQVMHVALAVVSLAAPHFALGPLRPFAPFLFLPSMAVFLYVPWLAWRGDRDARTISIGILVFGLARSYLVMASTLGFSSYELGPWAFGALIVAVAVSLSNRFMRVHSELDSLNHELESKVERRTSELAETVERLQVSEREARGAREEALEASQAKSVFLANMSHELRTPLNAVIGFSQLLERRRTFAGSDAESLRIIQRSGEHLLDLINDVLSISKIEAGKLTVEQKPFDLPELLDAVVAISRVRAEAKGLEVVSEIDPGLPRVIVGDEGKLRQVLINLLGNAVKFTDRGRVTLRAAWRDAGGGRGRAAYEIADTGRGISREEIGRLFEAFTQTESGRASKEGTGLGLAISRQIVQLMGGDISVESEQGRGSTFRFEVDARISERVPAARERRRVAGLAAGQTPPRVLVVDDTDENRLLLVELLTSVGVVVREAVNGSEAVERWDEWQPDLILMDMRMPVVDGREAVRRIRAAEAASSADGREGPRGGRTKIVALTASAFEHEREEILACGADDFVTKPFRAEAIFSRLSEHLGVRFRYEGGGATAAAGDGGLTADRLTALPAERISSLHDALSLGDFRQAAIEAEQIGRHDEPLGRALMAEINAFRLDELLALVEAAKTSS